MVRVKSSVASRKRRKRLLKKAKGFVGDRKNHIRLTKDAVMKAMAYNYEHRKQKKREFRKLWIVRVGIASKIFGISYSKFILGLKKSGSVINRKMLADLAIHDLKAFGEIAAKAKESLAA